jgi:hypothetical protein
MEHADPYSRIEAAYQVLSGRVSGNFDLQWRGPTFALTAQSFLFVGFLSAMQYPLLQILMAALIGFAGVVSALVMLHVRYMIGLDHQLLDKYEKTLLVRYPELRLHHASSGQARAAILGDAWHRRGPVDRLFLRLSPTLLWIIMLLTFSAVGVVLLIWAASHY